MWPTMPGGDEGPPLIPSSGAGEQAALQAEVRRLRASVDRLALVCRALWEVARDQHGLDEEELSLRVQEIDLRDGVADGRHASGAEPRRCLKCGRPMGRAQDRCLYCGTVRVPASPFEGI